MPVDLLKRDLSGALGAGSIQESLRLMSRPAMFS